MTPLLLLLLITACGFLGIAVALSLRRLIEKLPAGTPEMQSIARLIRRGAMTFLQREGSAITFFASILALILYAAIDRGGMPLLAGSFCFGAATSFLGSYLGMRIATSANVRAAEAARTSAWAAMRVAQIAGASIGLAIAGIGLAGVSISLLALGLFSNLPFQQTVELLIGYSFGASSIALFLRVGGGVAAKAADIAADVVGKLEEGILEDDPRNPAALADSVGDNVGDIAGMGADLYESYVAAIVAAMIIGATKIGSELAMLFPLAVAAVGIVAAVLTAFFVRPRARSRLETIGAERVLKGSVIVHTFLVLVGSLTLVHWLFPSSLRIGVTIALLAGLFTGIMIGLLTEYYTSPRYAPVRHVAEAAETGAATSIIAGLALGYLSTALPLICIALAAGVAAIAAGAYGMALAAVGMLATLGTSLAIDAYGPIADNARGIAAMSGLPPEIRKNADAMDAAARATRALGKGFAIGAAALTILALLSAYFAKVQMLTIDLQDPLALIGLLIGGMLPFLASSFTMHAVSRAARATVQETRGQFQEIPGLLQGKAPADPARCIELATNSALHDMTAPSLLAILAPVGVGIFLGSQALGSLLLGSLATGVPLAIAMATSGSAWDSARKTIEAQKNGSASSEQRKAAIMSDTVGDPFKDISGPALTTLLKLMTTTAVLTAGWYGTMGLIG